MMDKDMVNAVKKWPSVAAGKMVGTGITLLAKEKGTDKQVNYGVQLNNTTLEIEALPNLKVEIRGYQDMYEELKETLKELTGSLGEWDSVNELYAPAWTHSTKRRIYHIEQALSKAEGLTTR